MSGARLEWSGAAYKRLTALLAHDPVGVQQVVALAVNLAHDPDRASAETTSVAGYWAVRGGGWFLVFTRDDAQAAVRVVGFGTIA